MRHLSILAVLGLVLSCVSSARADGLPQDQCDARLSVQAFVLNNQIYNPWTNRYQGTVATRATAPEVRLEMLAATMQAGVTVTALPTRMDVREKSYRVTLERSMTVDDFRLLAKVNVTITRQFDENCWFVLTESDPFVDFETIANNAFTPEGVRASDDWVGRPNCGLDLNRRFVGFDRNEGLQHRLESKIDRRLVRGGYERVMTDESLGPSTVMQVTIDRRSGSDCQIGLEVARSKYIRANVEKSTVFVGAHSCAKALRALDLRCPFVR